LLLASKLPASRVDRTPHRHEARACFSFVRRYYEERAARADICATPRLARLALPSPDRKPTPAIKTQARNVLAVYRALQAMTSPH